MLEIPQPVAGCPFVGGAAAAADLADPGLYSAGDPHPVWSELRAHDPVSRRSAAGGHAYWSVTKYSDADTVLRDHGTFTSERGTLLVLLGQDDPAGGRQMAATDPPRHGDLREPLQRALTIKRVEAKREQIREAVLGLITPLGDGGTYDLAEQMTKMPMAVIGSLMDLPHADRPRLIELTTAAIAPDAPRFARPGGTRAVLKAAHRELFAYFQDLVTERQRAPGDDLVSLLLRMEMDGRTLTAGEIVANCYSLLLGASVTMAQVPVTALDELMGTAVLDDWANDPTALASGVEEALRWSSPTNHFMRYATRDVRLRGKDIAAGDAVVVWLGSANRDEEVFDDPFTFDIRRRPNKHIAFGIGPHYCVGHTVARVALKVVMAELFSRFRDFAPAGPGVRLHSNIIAGWESLPVTARVRPSRAPVAY
ncbi:cytochrome P450 [Streptomyces winkii]|uniref:cytochrome P450 n=1 Tax=Streptomyces winkii TaxID=3051178 RepID=UPI0028D1E6BF|nr:cytochrome P450 [Streptomyces sp. DSM 40971]